MLKEAGLKGIMHSDELPAYGIDNEETENIKLNLGCNDNDAFILILVKKKLLKMPWKLSSKE